MPFRNQPTRKFPIQHVYNSAAEIADSLARELHHMMRVSATRARKMTIALSGGTTPLLLLERLVTPPEAEEANWDRVHFFWGDERCVPPDHSESNFGAAHRLFLSKVSIPVENIHRIRGEAVPEDECKRYAREIADTVQKGKDGLPIFDWILLGTGPDGHTASLFPGAVLEFGPLGICGVATHPITGQKRITLSPAVINHARRVTVLATGKEKAQIVREILSRSPVAAEYPTAKLNPSDGVLEWYIDHESASLLQTVAE